jgi:glycosyltransferase involved in cell wall biosynthesis
MWAHADRYRAERRIASALPTIAVSQYVKDEMVRAGYNADGIIVVHSPAPNRSRPLPFSRTHVPRFLFLGRVVPEKGLAWLLRAVAAAPVPIHLDVAGDGYALADAREACDALGIGTRVAFHGWVAPNGIDALLANARAVVVPSLWHEPAGLVTLEAAAAGRAVVGSRVGGIPEYARPEFALLAEPNDTDGLASLLTRLAVDAPLAHQMGHAAYEVSQRVFSLDQFVDAVEAVYDRAIQSTHLPI